MEYSNLAVGLVFGVDDALGWGVLVSGVCACVSLATGLLTVLRRKAARKIEVKLPGGKALTLSQSMSPQEKAARIDEIKAVLASFEQDTTARHQEPVPATHA